MKHTLIAIAGVATLMVAASPLFWLAVAAVVGRRG
jgi:hypothetical protein